MSYTSKTISEVVTEMLNRNTFLPAIQREYVWDTAAIEKLFDSILADFPISTFLFWKIREEKKKEWAAYSFISDFDKKNPHNKEANLDGVNQDIYLVLDGQQRLTSLLIGLKGSYTYQYYKRDYKNHLYLNLLHSPPSEDLINPEELRYHFQFRENDTPNSNDNRAQFWYRVGEILNFDDAEEAKKSMKSKLANLKEDEREMANSLIGRLHSRVHTSKPLNYYEEKSQEYDKVVEEFIRVNTGGVKLEYSDILLSTATAKWKNLNARHEIYSFTDSLNQIGNGYSFGKDFVLKGCLYLTDELPIAYKIKNFTPKNLEKIEDNWETIKASLMEAVRLANKFGFSDKNLVAKIALLPIALYIRNSKIKNFTLSTDKDVVDNQILMQKWIVVSFLKNAFASSTDSTLKNLQDVLNLKENFKAFPYAALFAAIKLDPKFSDTDFDNYLSTNYGTKYSYLILSLLYPDRDWKDKAYNEDHIFPRSEFTDAKLKNKYSTETIKSYYAHYNTVLNLQLLTETENKSKNDTSFDIWLSTRDANFKERHQIPEMASYSMDNFLEFIQERKKLVKEIILKNT